MYFSDAKSISKALGLEPSSTRDYLKQLVDEGILEVEGEYKNRKYRIKKIRGKIYNYRNILYFCHAKSIKKGSK